MKERIDVRLTPVEANRLRVIATEMHRSKADALRWLLNREYDHILKRGVNPPGYVSEEYK
jgi:hypothetical protein